MIEPPLLPWSMDQVTAVLVVPDTDEVNCTVAPEDAVADAGDTVTTIGAGGGFSIATTRPPK